MALDEATQKFLAALAEQGGKPLHEGTPEQAREMGPLLTEMQGPGPEMARVEDTTLATADGSSFDVRTFVPTDSPVGVIVYYHGGGWVIGDITQYDNLGRQLAERTNSVVVIPNYRKAPEHRYPAAVDDAWQTLLWTDENIERIAGKRLPLIVAGDSSGGNLSAIMTQRAKANAGPAISQQVLVYPVTNDDLFTASYLAPENQLLLSKESMVWFWDHYADEPQRADTDASPLKAQDLSGLPPAVVLIAEHDVLRDEGEAYAKALAAAGVPVEQKLFHGQMHGFFSMVNLLPGSAAGLDYVAKHVNNHLASPVTTA